jgi:diaminopimelate epimerase
MEKVFFTKMSGAGNDFVIIDNLKNPDISLTPEKIIRVCNRRTGIGADGLITVANKGTADFEMDYYNADGSTGSLCANGARCAIKFAFLSQRLKNKRANFLANGVSYSGEVIDNELVKFNLNPPQKIKYNFKIKASGQLISANYVDTGSPHVVIKISDVLKNPNNSDSFYDDLKDFPVFKLGKEIRYLPEFSEGTNVNFIMIDEGEINIRTYERGVEDETLACGTGSVAAAFICYATDKLKPPITLNTRGGNKLIVNFEVENQKVKNLSLTGPAEIIFEGWVDKNFFI